MLLFLFQNHSNKIYWNTLRMVHKIFSCSISYNRTISTNSGHGVAGVRNCRLDLLAQTCIPTVRYVWAHAVIFNVTDPLMYSEPLRSTIFNTPVPVLFVHSFFFLADLVPPQLLHKSLFSSTYDEQTFFSIYIYFVSAFASLQLVITLRLWPVLPPKPSEGSSEHHLMELLQRNHDFVVPVYLLARMHLHAGSISLILRFQMFKEDLKKGLLQ